MSPGPFRGSSSQHRNSNTCPDTNLKHTRTCRAIFLLSSLVLLWLESISLTINSHYRFDIVICWSMLAAAYRWRRQLSLNGMTYFLLASFLVLHSLGVFRLYESFPLGIEFDYWVHGYFGITAALIIYRIFVVRQTGLPPTGIALVSLMLVMGLAAMHELYEFAGALLLGEGEGLLFIGAGDLDQWDTQKDMLNNLVGAIAGLLMARFQADRA